MTNWNHNKFLTLIKAGSAHIVNDQFFFTILPSKLPDAHLDEILESGVHVDILVLQLAVTGPELRLLHKPRDNKKGRKSELNCSQRKCSSKIYWLCGFMISSPDNIHGGSTRFKEVGGFLNLSHISQNALPDHLWTNTVFSCGNFNS